MNPPLPVIVGALEIVQRIASHRQAEAEHTSNRRQAELLAQVRALELQMQGDEFKQKIALISEIANHNKELELRKAEIVLEVFNTAHSLLADQQKALNEERKALRRDLSTIQASKEKLKFAQFTKDINAISTELDDIRRSSVLMQMQVNFFMENIGANFRLPSLPSIEQQ